MKILISILRKSKEVELITARAKKFSDVRDLCKTRLKEDTSASSVSASVHLYREPRLTNICTFRRT
jgi:hypothetical protein